MVYFEEKEMETRQPRKFVTKYGAVPVEPFPAEGENELRRANWLRNNLVEIHEKDVAAYNSLRREASPAYRKLDERLEIIERSLREAKREGDEPPEALIDERKKLWEDIKKPRKEANALIKENPEFAAREKECKKEAERRLREAAQVDQCELMSKTAGDILEKFRTSRGEFFKALTKKSAGEIAGDYNLRFHAFHKRKSGYFHYRLSRTWEKQTADGVFFEDLHKRKDKDKRPFVILDEREAFEQDRRKILNKKLPKEETEQKLEKLERRWEKRRRKKPNGEEARIHRARLKLATKKGTGSSDVYCYFDLVLHRLIPEGALIKNAQLVRRRIGQDKFKYHVCFFVEADAPAGIAPSSRAGMGIDIGWKEIEGELRTATVAIKRESDDHQTAFKPEHITVREEWRDATKRVNKLKSALDKSAVEFGAEVGPLLRKTKAWAGANEKDSFRRIIRAIVRNAEREKRTVSFETVYSLVLTLRERPDALAENEDAARDAIARWARSWEGRYHEYHYRVKRLIGRRDYLYRLKAKEIVDKAKAERLPIGIEDGNLLREFKDKEKKGGEHTKKSRGQLFDAAPGVFIGAVKNCAEREGVRVVHINPAYTSRKCSTPKCDYQNEADPGLRWKCPECGTEHDRDENGAMNLATKAMEGEGVVKERKPTRAQRRARQRAEKSAEAMA